MAKRDAPEDPATAQRDTSGAPQEWSKGGFDRLLSVHRPLVLAHLRQIRKQKPNATPAQVATILEQRYLAAVTTGGAAVGAAAVIPGVGTVASLAISGAETAGFLEASALFAQSIAELHGVATEDPERSSALVMALMIGSAGGDLVRQFAGEASGNGQPRTAFWGELVTKRMPKALMDRLTTRIRKTFLQKFAAKQGAHIIFRAAPFGIGAVVGGTGNHMLGRKVVKSSREAFGPAPMSFPGELTSGSATSLGPVSMAELSEIEPADASA